MRHALIFAAGRGERLRPLTDHTPKPLLPVGGKPLIAWHLEKLAAIGVHDVVINTSHLAGQFPDTLGDGSRWGLRIRYAYEGATALETGGGMLNALPLLGSAPFIALSGDIWTDADFASLPAEPPGLAHLMMVDNPEHHPHGDFALDAQGLLHDTGEPRLTFSGLGIYRRQFLDGWQEAIGGTGDAGPTPPRFKLVSLLRAAIAAGTVTGFHHHGVWTDVGTPGRMQAIRAPMPGAPGIGHAG
ncbi:MAG: nucleotidyltransferase family protein [Xanthomonadaceae bacterium]|nr:nucleotidyltransferase family protein [Xanthomonadaceae bacterium]